MRNPDYASQYQAGLNRLSRLRVKAANSSNALEFATYCMATGIDPEPQYTDLFIKGVEERKEYSDTTEKLEFLIEKILYGSKLSSSDDVPVLANYEDHHEYVSKKDAYFLDFLNKAKTYNSDVSKDLDLKIKLLQSYFPKFREGGNTDLTKYLAMEMTDETRARLGRQFNHIVEGYQKKYSKSKVKNKVYSI